MRIKIMLQVVDIKLIAWKVEKNLSTPLVRNWKLCIFMPMIEDGNENERNQ